MKLCNFVLLRSLASILMALFCVSLCSNHIISAEQNLSSDGKPDKAILNVPGTYATIQAAINAAVNGDTVLVADGTFTGASNKNLDFLGKQITVRSVNGPAATIIDCQGTGGGVYFHTSEPSSSILQGFTITNGDVHGIRVISASPQIINCTLTNFTYNGTTGNAYAIYCSNANPTITNCRIGPTSYHGIYCMGTSAPSISNSTISSCGYNSIYMENPGSGGQISNCIISSSGGGYQNISIIGTASFPISGNTISDAGTYGLYCGSTSSAPLISDNDFLGNNSYPIYMYARNAAKIDALNSFIYNSTNMIYIVSDTISLDSTWQNIQIPFYLTGEVIVQGTDGIDSVTTLTLSAGSELRFGSTCGLTIGSDSSIPGALRAIGTNEEHILFTANTTSPTPGYWDGIYFGNYSNDSICLLEYCDIEYGGYSSNENIYCNASSPTVNHCTIRFGSGSNIYAYNGSNPLINNCTVNSATTYNIQSSTNSNPQISFSDLYGANSYGVYVSNSSSVTLINSVIRNNLSYGLFCNGSSDSATVNGCSFNDNSNCPIRIYASKCGAISGCSYSGNSVQKVELYGDTIQQDTTWQNQGIPYYVNSSAHVYVQGTSGADAVTSLTIMPGTEIQISMVYFWIGHDSSSSLPGALIANGTPSQPIKFTSSQLSPSPGNWYGIYFANYSSDSLSSLKNCIIEYGGNTASFENIQCNESSPTLQNCTIRYGDGNGIRAYSNNANPTLINCTVEYNTGYGAYASPGTIQISGGTIRNNSTGGLYINTNASASGVTHVNGAVIENNSGGYGFYIDGSASDPIISSCIIDSNNAASTGYGAYITNSAVPVLSGSSGSMNTFHNHSSYAVYNATTTTCINARYNFWGISGGPMDTSYTSDGCMNNGNSNPGAERISNDIDYSNWENSDLTPTPGPTNTPTITPTTTPIPCYHDGDVNDDGQMTVTDAQLTYMIFLGVFTPTTEQECSADCNANSSITMDDAQCIYMNFLGAGCSCSDPVNFHIDLVGNNKNTFDRNSISLGSIMDWNSSIVEDLAAHNLIWIENVRPCNDDQIEVSIMISNPDFSIDAVGFDISYCQEELTYIDCVSGMPAGQWILFGGNTIGDGRLRVACFANPNQAIPEGSLGILATLTFEINHENCDIGDRCEFRFLNLTDDLSGTTGLSGDFIYCELKPSGIQETLQNKTLSFFVADAIDETLENQ